MPISRSSTIKAKSPRPPTTSRTPSTPSTPRFLPPSHYAAAGGFKTPNRSLAPTASSTAFAPEENAPTDAYYRNPPAAPNGTSNSTQMRTGIVELEAQLLPTLRDTIDRMTGTSGSRYSMGPQQFDSIPTTHQQAQHPPPQNTVPFREEHRAKPSRRGTPTVPPPMPTVAPSKRSESRPRTPKETSTRWTGPETAPAEGFTRSGLFHESTPVVQQQHPPPSRLKTPSKSALKSSLRSPTPRHGPSTSTVPPVTTPRVKSSVATPPTPATGSSLKSVKTLLTRRCSGKLKSPFSGKDHSSRETHIKANRPEEDHDDTERRRRVSFSPLPPEQHSDRMFEESTQAPSNSNRSRSTVDPEKNPAFSSNIPRPRQSGKTSRRSSPSNTPSVPPPPLTKESSDFEHQYESRSRDRRRLTVANAEIDSVSSSNSNNTGSSSNAPIDDADMPDMEATPRFPHNFATTPRTPRPYNHHTPTQSNRSRQSRPPNPSVGLGLSFPQLSHAAQPSSLHPSHRSSSHFADRMPSRAPSPQNRQPQVPMRMADDISDSQSITSTYSDDLSASESSELQYLQHSANGARTIRDEPGYSDHSSRTDSDTQSDLVGGDEELKQQYMMHHRHYPDGSFDSPDTHFQNPLHPFHHQSRDSHAHPYYSEEELDSFSEVEEPAWSQHYVQEVDKTNKRRSFVQEASPHAMDERWDRATPPSAPATGFQSRIDGKPRSALSRIRDKRRELESKNESPDSRAPPSLKDLIQKRHPSSSGTTQTRLRTDSSTPEMPNSRDHPTSDSRRPSYARNTSDEMDVLNQREPGYPRPSKVERTTRRSADANEYYQEDRHVDDRWLPASSLVDDMCPEAEPVGRVQSSNAYPVVAGIPHSEAATVAERYRSAAAKERQAFGIPLSDSLSDGLDEFGALSQSESGSSSLNKSLTRQRDQEDEELGMEAQGMLRRLGVAGGERENRKHPPSSSYDSTPRLSIVSPTLSSESTSEELAGSWQSHGLHHNSDSVSSASTNPTTPCSYNSDLPAPDTRESVIQEIFYSEEELVRRLHVCMEYFILPLRLQNSRSWISGVPISICRQFDWFDDIVNLHEQVYESLCSARDTMTPATDRVSESLRWWVMKAEVYQPYIVKLGSVKEAILRLKEGLATDDGSAEFGEFMRIREVELGREEPGWTLERFLMLPVERLASYQDIFARLLDLTPKTHQDYLSTLSLARSTEMVIRVVTEVKTREDDYQLLKTFASQIRGLPLSSGLATRDRRLLHSGTLQLVLSNLSELSIGHELQVSPDLKRASRSSRLLDAISNKPNLDLQQFPSASTISPAKGAHNAPPSSSKPSWFSRLPLRRRSRRKSLTAPPIKDTPDDASLDSLDDISLRTVDVHAFVFTDVVLLAQQGRNGANTGSRTNWILAEDLGLFRPMSIARIRRRNAQEGMIISMESSTVDAQHLNDTLDFRLQSWRIVDLLLPPPSTSNSSGNTDRTNSNDYFQPWLGALRECCRTTVRKLTFVGATSSYDASGTLFLGDDKTLDTHAVVSSLASSGLPLPRSPSGNLPDLYSDGRIGRGDEREERGWWSLRYQQVFREFQRRDSLLFDDDDE